MTAGESPKPHLLFVCVSNGGKSQMAAALARQLSGDAVEVTSAGTNPGTGLNQQSVEALREVGATVEGEHPKPLTDDMLRSATHLVILGTEAKVVPVAGMSAQVQVWDIDEPSLRGIEGADRMRLVRDDISRRVVDLVMEVTGQPAEHAAEYQRIVADLAARYAGSFSEEEVRAHVRAAHAELAPGSHVRTFLPVFVERRAHERLRAAARRAGSLPEGRPEVLFVCVHNAGRSQIAAAMARHFSRERVVVRSAGSSPTGAINPLALQVLQERGIHTEYLFSKEISADALEASDIVVSMEPGLPPYPGKHHLEWVIADPEGQSIEQVRRIADEIEVRVKELLAEIL